MAQGCSAVDSSCRYLVSVIGTLVSNNEDSGSLLDCGTIAIELSDASVLDDLGGL